MTDELLARHRAVMPSWMSLLYEEPIEIVHAHDRRMTDVAGPHLPRLLRRRADQLDGLRRRRDRRRGPQAARHRHPAHLDAVPDPLAGRAGRADRVAVRHPGREGVLHQLRQRGQRHGVDARDAVPAQQPGAGDAQLLPRPVLRDGRDHRQPRLVGVGAEPGQGQLRPRRVPLPQPVPGPVGRRLHRGLRRRPGGRAGHGDGGRRRVPDRRADPGRRRVQPAAGRAVPGDEGGAAIRTGCCSSPTRSRRAGAAPASTSGASRRTA